MENMKNERDGLRYPSIDELTDKSSSKYKLVIAASKRAKEIDLSKKSYLESTKNFKSIGIALEEIIADKVKIADE
ncbi:MAG: DNA-directed RNA polymerase subunit omega [Prevotella sp.]|nr:DNA-directed RNA polymerase subunit omega [Staphylococcus sp.]MCM1350203.1 DNA-directed RNA polymerase subunit omega [Prevotella sp.]